MSFEEEFDKIIRQKVQQHQVPFDQTNWDKAQQLMDGQKVSLPAKKVWSVSKIIGITGLSTALAVSAYFYNRTTSTPQVSAKTSAVQNSVLTPETNETASSASNQNNQVPVSQTNIDISQQLNTTIQNNAASKPLAGVLPSNQSPNNNNVPQITIVNTDKESSNTNTANQTTGQSLVKPNAVSTEQSPIANDLPTQNLQQSSITASGELIMTTPESFVAQTNNNAQSTEPSQSMPPVNQQVFTTDNNKPFLNIVVAQLPQRGVFQAFDTDTVLKTITNEIIKIKDDFSASTKTKTRFLNVGAGIDYCNGWHANTNNDGRGFNYYAHANYGFYVKRHWSLSAGLDFYNIQNISQAFYTTQKTEYGFTSSNTFTSVVSNNLKYIGIPLKLSYDLNSGNILSLGVLPAFLVAAQNRIDVYKQLDGQKTMLSQTNNKVLYDGVAQKNIQISLGFKLKVSSRIWLQSDLMVGLTDLFINNASEKHLQKPLGIRLGLQYHLFDK